MKFLNNPIVRIILTWLILEVVWVMIKLIVRAARKAVVSVKVRLYNRKLKNAEFSTSV